MSSNTIAVVIPVYNRAGVIGETLNTVLHQSVQPRRVVVVDDGSVDDSGRAVLDWNNRVKPSFEMRFIQQENGGPNAARNRGCEEVGDSSVIAFLDSDDLWPAGYLSEMCGWLEKEPEAVAVSRNYRVYWVPTGESEVIDVSGIARDGPRQTFLSRTPVPSATVVRTSAHRSIGGFDSTVMVGDDREYFMRLSLLGRWLWDDGEPATIQRFISRDDAATSRAHHSCCGVGLEGEYALLELRGRFIHEQGGGQALKASEWKSYLARKWYRLGRKFIRCGQRSQASECFKKSLAYQPYAIRPRIFEIVTRQTQ